MEKENGYGLTLRELVLEIRDDVKALDEKIDKIDRQGSIGTKEQLASLDSRVDKLEVHDFRLSGVWTSLGILGAAFVGLSGLALAILNAIRF